MILKGSQRGHASRLAHHLLNDRDNEHVEVHEIRGFVSTGLLGALKEAEAISKGTRCQQHLFSLSLNPPENEDVAIDIFETAIEMIEQKLGLDDQPRAIVFHEKEGRRHAHVVWSRIDIKNMTAVPLPYSKNKLMEVSKEIYFEQGWDMPKGFINKEARNPLNFTRAEWQQANRVGQDPRMIKAIFQHCWESSDNRSSFEAALRDYGYWLAKGDRRGFVVLDHRGEVYSLSRYTGVKNKQLKERLGHTDDLPEVLTIQSMLSGRMTEKLTAWRSEQLLQFEKKNLTLNFNRGQIVMRHRKVRLELKKTQAQRKQAEELVRAARLPKGIKAIWSWISGSSKKIKIQNASEIARCEIRDRTERHEMIKVQLIERRNVQKVIKRHRSKHHEALAELDAQIAEYIRLGGKTPEIVSNQFNEVAQNTGKPSVEMNHGLDNEL